MLDTSVYNNMNFNSVSGTLVKSSAESKFIQFGIGSRYADMFFDPNKPYKGDKQYIEVLQVMLCGNDKLLVEYIDIKDCR